MIYFDYTATTKPDKEILDTYIKVSNDFYANSTSLHSLGEESNHMYDICVKGIKEILNTPNHNLVFTSNATEANNLAILGITGKHSGGKIITSALEHPSVYNTIDSLKDKFDICYLNVKENGLVDLDTLEKEMNDDVVLVSIMWVNNILGTIQNIKRVIEIVKKYPKAKLHVDLVQGMCKIVPDFSFSDIDLFTLSIHKIYGPKGIAILAFNNSIDLNKRLFGSSAQYKVKPGTIDIALIATAYKTLKKYYPLTLSHYEDVKLKFDYLYNHLKVSDKFTFNTPRHNVTCYILNISIKGIKGETMVHMLDSKGIYVSTSSSCSSKLQKIDKTIMAISNNTDRSLNSIRISLSHLTTFSELDELIKAIDDILTRKAN